jgi:hypothetical protein
LLAGTGLLRVTATAAGIGEPSLWAVGVLGPALQVWAPEEQCSSTASMGELSLRIVGVLGSDFPHRLQGTESAGLCLLLSLLFQGESSRLCSRGEHGSLSSCVCWVAGLTAKQVLSNGAWRGVGDGEY